MKVKMGHIVLLRPGKGAHRNRKQLVKKGHYRKRKHKGRDIC